MLVNLTVAYFRIEKQWKSIVVSRRALQCCGRMEEAWWIPNCCQLFLCGETAGGGWESVEVTFCMATVSWLHNSTDICCKWWLHYVTFPNHAPSFSRPSTCLCLCSSSYVWYINLHTHGIYLYRPLPRSMLMLDMGILHHFPTMSTGWSQLFFIFCRAGQLVAQHRLRSCQWNQSQTCLMNDESPFPVCRWGSELHPGGWKVGGDPQAHCHAEGGPWLSEVLLWRQRDTIFLNVFGE